VAARLKGVARPLPSEPRSPEARRRLVLDGEVLLQSSRIPQSIGVAVITNIPPAVRNLDGPDDDSRRQVAGMLGNLSPSGGRVRWTKTSIQVDPLPDIRWTGAILPYLLAAKNQFDVRLADADGPNWSGATCSREPARC
jgi:hypothetical protein